jgi:glutamate-1-semialdehyde 2,1-aminomutase
VQLVRIGSIFWFAFQDGPAPRSAESIAEDGAAAYRRVFHGMLERGFALAPSAFEVGFLSLAHTREQLRDFAAALADCLETLPAERR